MYKTVGPVLYIQKNEIFSLQSSKKTIKYLLSRDSFRETDTCKIFAGWLQIAYLVSVLSSQERAIMPQREGANEKGMAVFYFLVECDLLNYYVNAF